MGGAVTTANKLAAKELCSESMFGEQVTVYQYMVTNDLIFKSLAIDDLVNAKETVEIIFQLGCSMELSGPEIKCQTEAYFYRLNCYCFLIEGQYIFLIVVKFTLMVPYEFDI